MDRSENLVLKDPEPRIHPSAELKACKLGRYASISERVVLREVTVGDFSYFERHSEAIYTTIGKFCSIAANSRIKDVDVAQESTQYARYNILVQAGTAMLAQANSLLFHRKG